MNEREFTEKDREMALQALEELDAAGRWDHYKSAQQADGSVPSNGNTPIAASAGSAGQPPVSPAPSLSSGESSAVKKAPVATSEGE